MQILIVYTIKRRIMACTSFWVFFSVVVWFMQTENVRLVLVREGEEKEEEEEEGGRGERRRVCARFERFHRGKESRERRPLSHESIHRKLLITRLAC